MAFCSAYSCIWLLAFSIMLWHPTVLCVKLKIINSHCPIIFPFFHWRLFCGFQFEAIMTNMAMKILAHVSSWKHTSFFVGYIPKMKIAGWYWLLNVLRLISSCTSVSKKQGMWSGRYAYIQTPKNENRSRNLFSPIWKRNFLPMRHFWTPALFQLCKDAVLIALVYFVILMRSPHCCNSFSKHDTSWLHSENWVSSQLCASGS